MTPSGGRARRPPRPRHTTCSARGHPGRRRRRLCLRRPPPGPGSPLPRLRAARRGRTQLPLPAGRARRRGGGRSARFLPPGRPGALRSPFRPGRRRRRRLPPRDGAALAPGAARRGGLPGPGPPPPVSYLEPLLGRYATRPAALPPSSWEVFDLLLRALNQEELLGGAFHFSPLHLYWPLGAFQRVSHRKTESYIIN